MLYQVFLPGTFAQASGDPFGLASESWIRKTRYIETTTNIRFDIFPIFLKRFFLPLFFSRLKCFVFRIVITNFFDNEILRDKIIQKTIFKFFTTFKKTSQLNWMNLTRRCSNLSTNKSRSFHVYQRFGQASLGSHIIAE